MGVEPTFFLQQLLTVYKIMNTFRGNVRWGLKLDYQDTFYQVSHFNIYIYSYKENFKLGPRQFFNVAISDNVLRLL